MVYLLASLPKSYSMFVTALEIHAEVPKMELVTERLLHKKKHVEGREAAITSNEKIMAAGHRYRERGPKYYNCGKYVQIKRNCRSNFDRITSETDQGSKQKANTVQTKRRESSSDSESVGLTVQHAMSSHSRMDAWIVDSCATSHMCIHRSGFMQYESLKTSLKVTLEDVYKVDAIGCGTVVFYSGLPCGKSRK